MSQQQPLKWTHKIEPRLKVLAMYYVIENNQMHFVMIKSAVDTSRRGVVEYAPPGGSVHQRTAFVMAIADFAERSELLADNAAREFNEEVLKSPRGVEKRLLISSGRGSRVVGGLRDLPKSACPIRGGIGKDKLMCVIRDVDERDIGAYVEVEYQRAGDLPIRKYYAHNDTAVLESIADGSYSPPDGDDHELTRVLLNVIAIDVRNITDDVDAFDALTVDDDQSEIAEGVFLDGEPARDAPIVAGPRLNKLLRLLRARDGEIKEVHVMSKARIMETLRQSDALLLPDQHHIEFRPWEPYLSAIGKDAVWTAVADAASVLPSTDSSYRSADRHRRFCDDRSGDRWSSSRKDDTNDCDQWRPRSGNVVPPTKPIIRLPSPTAAKAPLPKLWKRTTVPTTTTSVSPCWRA